MSRIFALCIVIAILASCARRDPLSKAMDTWMGQTSIRLTAVWGQPTETIQEGTSTIYVYVIDSVRETTTIETSLGDSTSVTEVGAVARRRLFWVNAEGIIHSWAWRER